MVHLHIADQTAAYKSHSMTDMTQMQTEKNFVCVL